MQTVVDLINEYADITRLAARESDDAYAKLALPLGLHAATEDLVELANELYPAFARPDSAVQLLNALADSTGLQHRLDNDGRLTWIAPVESNGVRAAATVSLIAFVASHGTGTLGTCGAQGCVDVYTDRSPAQARTYCSERCNNRSRAARWRARHRRGNASSEFATIEAVLFGCSGPDGGFGVGQFR